MIDIFENPLARMYGPYFLILFSSLYVLAFAFIWFKLPNIVSGNKVFKLPKIPKEPNPYELAYMRGGEKEVALLSIYSLINKKYVRLLTNDTRTRLAVVRKDYDANYGLLNSYEKIIYEAIRIETDIVDLIQNKVLMIKIKDDLVELKQRLIADGILCSEKEKNKFKLIKLLFTIILIVLGGYKLLAAQAHGHKNIMFIIMIAIGGSLIIESIKINEILTKKGKSFLENIRTIFESISGNRLIDQPLYMQQLLISLYGFKLLKESKKDIFTLI